jgi:transcription initiation factor TFIIIB Brf1 subunit/transcription initiation factor TFIIB
MAKSKHKTPKHLDHLFERKVVTKQNYADFWEGYWGNKRSRDRDLYVDKFISDLQLDFPIKEKRSENITTSLRAAKQQAKEIGGYVVRRNKKGQFSRTGRHYQAVARKQKRMS